MKIRLYLLGYKGYKTLLQVINHFNSNIIETVIIGTDKGVQNDFSHEIRKICEDNSINYIFRNEDKLTSTLLSIAIGWRRIIDLERIPKLIILHDSILPKYRGFNPLVSALINGEKQIGVTALHATNAYDEGDIIFQSISEIKYPIKIIDAIYCITDNYCELIIKIVNALVNNINLPKTKQNEENATYSLWRDEEDYRINWNWESDKLKRFIDAVGYPYRGAFTIMNSEIVRIIDAEEYEDVFIENRTPGKIFALVKSKPIVVCEKGLLKINKMISNNTSEEINITKLKVRFK